MTVADISSGPLPETDAYVDLSLLDGGSFVGEIEKLHAGVKVNHHLEELYFGSRTSSDVGRGFVLAILWSHNRLILDSL